MLLLLAPTLGAPNRGNAKGTPNQSNDARRGARIEGGPRAARLVAQLVAQRTTQLVSQTAAGTRFWGLHVHRSDNPSPAPVPSTRSQNPFRCQKPPRFCPVTKRVGRFWDDLKLCVRESLVCCVLAGRTCEYLHEMGHFTLRVSDFGISEFRPSTFRLTDFAELFFSIRISDLLSQARSRFGLLLRSPWIFDALRVELETLNF